MMTYSNSKTPFATRIFDNARIEEIDGCISPKDRTEMLQSNYNRLVAEKPDAVSQQSNLSDTIKALETLNEFFENFGNRPGLKFLSVDFRALEGRLTPKLNKLHSEAVSKIQFLDAYQYKFPF